MKIYLMEDQLENTYKGVFILDVDFSLIVNLFEVTQIILFQKIYNKKYFFDKE